LIKYFKEQKEDNVTYSIDKIVIRGKFRHERNDIHENYGDMFYSSLSKCTYSLDFYKNTSARNGVYKDNFSFQATDTDTFWLGIGVNAGGKMHFDNWKLEFNPNKDAKSDVLPFVLEMLQKYSSDWELGDWDIAIDYPVLRENCFLIKDQRKYQLVQGSISDKTEYLGVRHQTGYSKLYNKQKESNLHYPLTRLELTVKGICSVSDVEEYIPTVYCIKDLQLAFEDMNMTGTNRVLLGAILNEPNLLIELPRKTREKIECALEQHTLQLGTNKKALLHIIQQAQCWCQLQVPK